MKKIIALSISALLLTTVTMSYADQTVKCPAAKMTFKQSVKYFDHWRPSMLGNYSGTFTIASASVMLPSVIGDGNIGDCTYTPDGLPHKQGEAKMILTSVAHLKPSGDDWVKTDSDTAQCIESGTVDHCLFQVVTE